MKTAPKAALLCIAALGCAGGAMAPSRAAGTAPGWPAYVAMGAVGGPNISPPTKTSTGGDDDFGGRPVDVVFKYAGSAGNGDPGMIDPPTNAMRMTGDLTTVSGINKHPTRVAIVEYTAQMSGGFSVADFSNSAQPDPASGGTHLMPRHFISLASDAIAMNSQPVAYVGKKYYGTLILNPDLMGSIQQGGIIGTVNAALPANVVNAAVDQALCFLTTIRTYRNVSNPNGLETAPYLKKTYTGTPGAILQQLLADGYPVWSIDGSQDAYWNTAIANTYSTPVSNWLQTNAPSTVKSGALGVSYVPDYFVFDRYESDDSAGAGQATLYNARSWDNYLTAVGLVSAKFNKVPIMLWQIPGSHIPYVGEAKPELYNDTPGLYAFSSAPDYFFGDSHLKADLSNIVAGPGSTTNSAVGNYAMACGTTAYNCTAGSTYKKYLLAYQGKANNYDWGRNNGKLATAVADHVFAILWGGGNTTNVIKNFSNTDDHGWLAGKIITYYKSPTPIPSQ